MTTMDLIDFLTARLDEDEDAARDAGAETWRVDGIACVQVDPGGHLVVYSDGTPPTSAQATHIARHDPARVLREVEAKRRIVDSAADAGPGGFGDARSHLILRGLSAAYSDHSDYRSEWRL